MHGADISPFGTSIIDAIAPALGGNLVGNHSTAALASGYIMTSSVAFCGKDGKDDQ